MKKFIELLKKLQQECHEQVDKLFELNDDEYHSICDMCRFTKQCELTYKFSEILFSNGVSNMDICSLEKIAKELGIYEDNMDAIEGRKK